MTIGEATIYLELDKVPGKIQDWVSSGNRCFAEHIGWARFCNLTKTLHQAEAAYDVHFEYVSLGPAKQFDMVHAAVILCAGAKLKASVSWITDWDATRKQYRRL